MTKSIIIGGKDRDYYRAMPTNELKEQIHYGINVDWKELAIALTERLDTIWRKVYDELDELDELDEVDI